MHQLLKSRFSQVEHGIELGAAEGCLLCCPLQFQQAAIAGGDHIEIHIGTAVFAVVEIQQGRPIDQPHRNRRQLLANRIMRQHTLGAE